MRRRLIIILAFVYRSQLMKKYDGKYEEKHGRSIVHTKVRNKLGVAKAGKLVFLYKVINMLVSDVEMYIKIKSFILSNLYVA